MVSDWPGKCGICNMALVRRKRGEALALPDGIIRGCSFHRTGFNWREFRPPRRHFDHLRGVRIVWAVVFDGDGATVHLEIPARQAPWIAQGQTADVACRELGGRDPLLVLCKPSENTTPMAGSCSARRSSISNPPRDLAAGMIAVVRVKVSIAGIEPFCSLPADPPRCQRAIRDGFSLPDHPENPTTKPGSCPIDRKQYEFRSLSDYERLRWWCPIHPQCNGRPGWGKLQRVRRHEPRSQSDLVQSCGPGAERSSNGGY